MYTWSLKELYNDFDQSFINDLQKLDENLDKISDLAENLSDQSSLEIWLKENQKTQKLARSLASYTSLRMATDANDLDAQKYYGQILNIFSKSAKSNALFSKWIYSVKDKLNNWIESSELIKEHAFILKEEVEHAKYALDEDVEAAISRMRINGSNAWSQLQSHLTSNATIEYNGETHTMTSLRNLAYHKDPQVRKEAYEKELELYKQIEDGVAFALNSIKGEVIQTNQMRGFENPLEETLLNSRLSKASLDALLQAIENNLPNFRKYFKHKAKLLGHEKGLPWEDMFAPHVVENLKEYSVEEAQSMIVDSFATFSDDLATMAKTAFEDNWVDFLPKEGKRGGAFCSNLPQIKQSRILMNFGGSISDIVTLAHELGHAYHGMMLQDNSPLNTGYTMPVAETASTFCENIVFNASLKTASDDEKIMLIENSLQDLTQITVDILSRFKFEDEVIRRREHEFLDTNTLQDIMLQAQKDSYGDGLDESTYNPYMWVCKGHYYSASNNYYNFPYAFGGLFALGLYAQYEKEGEAFVEKYRQLLKKTTTGSCEEVALMADIDTTDVAFWESSIDLINKRIDQYIELTK